MSCKHCCGVDRLFDEKSAQKDLKRYLRKGARKPTKLLTDALKKVNLNGLSLLDIGGGIGPIPLELIPNGISKVTDVDASAGYIKIAKREADKRNYSHLINYSFGDFVTESYTIESHDIVTLDKVICCYPNVNELLNSSLSKATIYYGIVYPQSNSASNSLTLLMNLWFRISKNPFRSYIHSPKLVRKTILSKGFTMIYTGKTLFSWHIEVYKKL